MDKSTFRIDGIDDAQMPCTLNTFRQLRNDHSIGQINVTLHAKYVPGVVKSGNFIYSTREWNIMLEEHIMSFIIDGTTDSWPLVSGISAWHRSSIGRLS